MPHLSRAQWAKRIRSAHTKTVVAVLKLGHTLSAAKKALPHGTFLKMIKHDLPFKPSTAQRLMAIAADPKIANAARAQLLPPAWGTLYELSKLPEATFEQAASAGTINPRMTRKDAGEIVRLQVTERTERLAAPYYNVPIETEEQTPRRFRLVEEPDLSISGEELDLLAKLEKLETLVVSISADVKQQNGVAPGSTAEKRIRALASLLLSLVEDRHVAAMN